MEKRIFFGREIWPFTIPSGIITTSIPALKWFADSVPELGILTTKSIGLKPRLGNIEPVLSRKAYGTYTNAVGLANPGAKEFADELKQIFPLNGKFLLVSIFGADGNEFTEVAKILEPYADGLELNVSCPHAEGYGAAIGSKKELLLEVVEAVKAAVNKPIIVKLTPNVDNIGEIARAAVSAGADAICAINTVGPVDNIDEYTKKPILTNIKGGLSGKGIKERGIQCTKEVSKAVDVPIIAMGGIRNSQDILDYESAGAQFFGIGSALAGLKSAEIKEYFSLLKKDLEKNSNKAEVILKEPPMKYSPFKIRKITEHGDDFRVFYFDKGIRAKPGQFVFLWIPGVSEKPFSVANNEPMTIAVKRIGKCTSKLFESKKGDILMVRGPYGEPIDTGYRKICLVGGGCGIAPLFFLAKELNKQNVQPIVLYGARTRDRILFEEALERISNFKSITDDRGFVTDLLNKELKNMSEDTVFYNCGPEIMIKKAVEIQEAHVNKNQIHVIAERYTKCGIGLCGSCSVEDGLRACVDGPVFDANMKLGKKRNAAGGYDNSGNSC